ncbi:MAG: thiol-disulfide oxidoreductase DCC family protein [Balneolales bacterium]|nr:thiol-disulfide oxidoreductase DCC family protein [Balneolales bacterium]
MTTKHTHSDSELHSGTDSEAYAIIFFDGVCNLCNASINFVIDRDSKRYFRYAPLQSETGQRFLDKHGKSVSDFDSVILSENGKVYEKSAAALRVARKMDGAWPLLYGFIIIPRFLRDVVYNLIAKNRYRWFGKEESCRMPTPELKQLFLS